MPTLIKYFDKKPSHAFTLGPSGNGIPSTSYSDEWRAWYEQGKGITYIKEADYVTPNSTGFHASGSQNILSIESLSVTFDSGAYLWSSFHNASMINILTHSGNGYILNATFSGQWPALYYDISNNQPSGRYIHCFYLKSGQNKIFARTNQDNFGSEIIYHQDLSVVLHSLQQVSRSDYSDRKLRIYGLDVDGNGYHLESECFNLFNTLEISDFEQYPSGNITTLFSFNCSPAYNIFADDVYGTDNYELYPSGGISLLNSGDNTIGYVWL